MNSTLIFLEIFKLELGLRTLILCFNTNLSSFTIVFMTSEVNDKVAGNITKFYNYSFPKLTVLVTLLDDNGKPNIITLAWHSACSIKPPMYGISIDPRRYSHDPIINTGEFVVNFCDPPQGRLQTSPTSCFFPLYLTHYSNICPPLLS